MSNPYIIVKVGDRENIFYQIYECCTDLDHEWYEVTKHNNEPTTFDEARERLKQMTQDHYATEAWKINWLAEENFNGNH